MAVEAFAELKPPGDLLAYVIAGHHAGLANGYSLQDRLDAKKYAIPAIDDWWQELTIAKALTPPPIKPHSEKSAAGWLMDVFTGAVRRTPR